MRGQVDFFFQNDNLFYKTFYLFYLFILFILVNIHKNCKGCGLLFHTMGHFL